MENVLERDSDVQNIKETCELHLSRIHFYLFHSYKKTGLAI